MLADRDSERALQIAGGSEPLATELLTRFQQSLPASLQELAALNSRSDWEELRSAVHRLHGAAAACALPRLTEALNALGKAARTHDANAAEASLEAVRMAVARIAQIG